MSECVVSFARQPAVDWFHDPFMAWWAVLTILLVLELIRIFLFWRRNP